MSSDVMHQVLQTIEDTANSTPSALEFEMAYQARVAIDRIRFAIKHTEHFGSNSDQMRQAGLQLLDALQRLETVERRFQERSRLGSRFPHAQPERDKQTENGPRISVPHQPVNASHNGGQDRPDVSRVNK